VASSEFDPVTAERIPSSGRSGRASDEEYPRVLTVGQMPITAQGNTALTLASLFADWPPERLRQLYADESTEDGPDGSGGWHVSLRSVPVYRTLRPFVDGYRRRSAGPRPTDLLPGIVSGSTGRWSLRNGGAVARAWADLLPYEVSPALSRWVRDFLPDVVFSPLGGSTRWIALVDRIAAGVQAPVVPFFGDDWPEVIYRFSGWVAVPRSVLARRLRRVLSTSPLLACGSDEMAREYGQRYGIPAEGFMRCVPIAQDRPAPPNGTAPLRLLYVGGLHLRRWEVLDRLGDALARLRDEGVPASLSIYAPAGDVAQCRERLARPGVVEVVGTLMAADVPATLAAADILVHVESFDEEVARYTRLSLSTKIPEYLASGRPLLMIGPRGLASLEYVRRCRAGLVVNQPDADAIAGAVRRLVREPALRAELGEAGWLAARSRHDGDRERARFRALLAGVARRPTGASTAR
jgi:hypothetical protein